MAMQTDFRIKQGGTFRFFAQLTEDETPLDDLTPYTVQATLKRGTRIIALFEVEPVSDPDLGDGWEFFILDTSDIAPGPADFDIRLSVGDDIYYTDTKTIDIEPSVTREGDADAV